MAQNGEEAKMWQKCGIFASNRPLWERIGNSGQKKNGNPSLSSDSRNFGKKMVGIERFELSTF